VNGGREGEDVPLVSAARVRFVGLLTPALSPEGRGPYEAGYASQINVAKRPLRAASRRYE